MATILHLSQQASIAIVEIAVASLTCIFSVLAIVYKGWSRGKIGFIYLALTALIHIVGSACYVSYELNDLAWAYGQVYATCSFISVGTLLMASLSFSQFTDATATNHGVSSIILSILHFLPVVAMVLGIAGGVEISNEDTSPRGTALLQASSIIFLVTASALVVISAINVSFVQSLRTLALAVSMPFLVVRVVLDILEAWAPFPPFSFDQLTAGAEQLYIANTQEYTQFRFNLPGYPAQIFMRFIPEYAIVLLYLFTGLGALKVNDTTGEESGSEFDKKDVAHDIGEPIAQPQSAHHYSPVVQEQNRV